MRQRARSFSERGADREPKRTRPHVPNKYVPSLLLAYRIARVFEVSIEGVFQFDQTAEDSGNGRPG